MPIASRNQQYLYQNDFVCIPPTHILNNFSNSLYLFQPKQMNTTNEPRLLQNLSLLYTLTHVYYLSFSIINLPLAPPPSSHTPHPFAPIAFFQRQQQQQREHSPQQLGIRHAGSGRPGQRRRRRLFRGLVQCFCYAFAPCALTPAAAAAILRRGLFRGLAEGRGGC